MGDWERTFGESGMADGGMGIVDSIAKSEYRESRRDAWLSFDSWEAARKWAKDNPRNAVTRDPNGSGYIAKDPTGPTDQSRSISSRSTTEDPTIAIEQRARELVKSWPSIPQGVVFMGNSITYREHQIFFDTDSASVHVRSGEHTIGIINYSDIERVPELFRAHLDGWLDEVGTLPASYIRPFGPPQAPPLDGEMALHLIASWPGCFLSHTKEEHCGEAYRRDHFFSYDSASSSLRIRHCNSGPVDTEGMIYLAEISLEQFQSCQRLGQSFRVLVDKVLDEIGASTASDLLNSVPDWHFHPLREAFLFIAGEESAWATSPPASLFRGYEIRITRENLVLMDSAGDPIVSFEDIEIRACGSIGRFMENLMRFIKNRKITTAGGAPHYEWERRFAC